MSEMKTVIDVSIVSRQYDKEYDKTRPTACISQDKLKEEKQQHRYIGSRYYYQIANTTTSPASRGYPRHSKMQSMKRVFTFPQNGLNRPLLANGASYLKSLVRYCSSETNALQEEGFETKRISDILNGKKKGEDGSNFWCSTSDTVFHAVTHMTDNDVGALLVLRPAAENGNQIAGIVTERDYLTKIIVQGRSSRNTTVGEIMTNENKLVTVSPDTLVLRAMQLMTENDIRHIPVCENNKLRGMVSMGDVIRVVVLEHREELRRLTNFIRTGGI